MSWTEDDTILYGQGDAGIWSVAVTGGKSELLVRVEEGEQAHGPQLLPGGEWVLFTFRPKDATSWDDARIVAQSVRTGERRDIVSGGRDARYIPTGHLVYGLQGALLAAPFDVSTLQVRGAGVSLVDAVGDAGGITGAIHFSVAANESLVYVPSLTGGLRRLVFVRRDGREESLAAEPRNYINPRVSPDGSRIAMFAAPDVDVWVWHVVRETLTVALVGARSILGHRLHPGDEGQVVLGHFEAVRFGKFGRVLEPLEGASSSGSTNQFYRRRCPTTHHPPKTTWSRICTREAYQ